MAVAKIFPFSKSHSQLATWRWLSWDVSSCIFLNVRQGKKIRWWSFGYTCGLCTVNQLEGVIKDEMYAWSQAKWEVMLGARWNSEVLRKWFNETGHKIVRKNISWFIPALRSSGNRQAMRARIREQLEHQSYTLRRILGKGWIFRKNEKGSGIIHFLKH